jgi:DNA invertase Pin-like site-specific DNA recombinase
MEYMATVEKIYRGDSGAPKQKLGLAQQTRRIRVAAYCRVSTDLEQQQSSLETQMSVFRQRISEHPGWVLAGIYADEGISATQAKNRKQFLQMLQDAEAGKIDYIITKSISRFARNTVECVAAVRDLQAKGVQVYFEKENLDTGTSISEMLLTVLAAFAQEESHSISENLKWGIRKRYEAGQVRWWKIYGYRKGENGEWLVEPEEAAVIRRIFRLYERGKRRGEIVEELQREGIRKNGEPWSPTMVKKALLNEKYAGDVRLQKVYIADHITHKAVRNDATEIPSYYVRDHHTPIVDRKTYDRVQRIRALHNNANGTMQYPYADTDLRCPCCGRQLIQRQLRSGGSARMVWACFGEGGCRGYAVKTWMLNEAVLRACAQCGDLAVPESVEYWWLDEYVARIELTREHVVTVHWKDGRASSSCLRITAWQNDPFRAAQMYRRYLDRLASGALRLASSQTPEDRAERRRRAAAEEGKSA